MGDHAISLQNVKVKRDHFSLGPINLNIPKGYVTAIVGPNGSGKSTMFRMMMNLVKPTEGSITILGHEINHENDDELKQRLAFVAEEPSSFDDYLRGEAKADFHSKWYSNWNQDTYQRMLSRLEVNDSIVLKKMSKGTRRKHELALAMGHRPNLLLLDEPSSGLDPIAWKTMIDIIHQFMENEENTVLMATHIIDEVKRLADYIVFVVDGQVLGMYEKDDLLQSWATYFVEIPAQFSFNPLEVPGYVEHKSVGGGFYEVISSQRFEMEQWLNQHSLQTRNMQLLELDEILFQHMKKVRKYA